MTHVQQEIEILNSIHYANSYPNKEAIKIT